MSKWLPWKGWSDPFLDWLIMSDSSSRWWLITVCNNTELKAEQTASMAAPPLSVSKLFTLEGHNATYPPAFEDKDIMMQDNRGFIVVHWTSQLDQNPPVLCFHWRTTCSTLRKNWQKTNVPCSHLFFWLHRLLSLPSFMSAHPQKAVHKHLLLCVAAFTVPLWPNARMQKAPGPVVLLCDPGWECLLAFSGQCDDSLRACLYWGRAVCSYSDSVTPPPAPNPKSTWPTLLACTRWFCPLWKTRKETRPCPGNKKRGGRHEEQGWMKVTLHMEFFEVPFN